MHMQKCADTKPKRRDAAPTSRGRNKAVLPSETTLLRFLNAPKPFSQTPYDKSSFLRQGGRIWSSPCVSSSVGSRLRYLWPSALLRSSARLIGAAAAVAKLLTRASPCSVGGVAARCFLPRFQTSENSEKPSHSLHWRCAGSASL